MTRPAPASRRVREIGTHPSPPTPPSDPPFASSAINNCPTRRETLTNALHDQIRAIARIHARGVLDARLARLGNPGLAALCEHLACVLEEIE